MNKVRILAVLVIVVLLGNTLKDAAMGLVDGWNDAGDSKEFSSGYFLSVKADKTLPADSLFNRALGQDVPYRMTEIETEVKPAFAAKVLLGLTFLTGVFALYGFWCMIRMVVSVTRGSVFIRKNVRRMRIFIYSVVLCCICFELYHWLGYREAASQIFLSGYEVVAYHTKYDWLFFIMMMLLTEIFAVGVKIKEEQDLTI